MNNNNNRTESDSLGNIEVNSNCLWGAVTQRSLINFAISDIKMPWEIIESLVIIKLVIAQSNAQCQTLEQNIYKAIEKSCKIILENSSEYQKHFPLKVWQTGSGTQTNMNVNEVIKNIAKQMFDTDLHPNDHVNLGQSTNDVFPTALHISTVLFCHRHVLPALNYLLNETNEIVKNNLNVIKIGRTHLQDATPLTIGNEFSAYVDMLESSINRITDSLEELLELPIGGTAVGTGINAHSKLANYFIDNLNQFLTQNNYGHFNFKSAKNRFRQLSYKDSLLNYHSTINTLASSLNKMANDIRWMGSGPRAGISEIILPANEPGSSIMPGKINPTQCEALMQVCAQIMGNDVALSIANSNGNFQLNTYMPMIGYNIILSSQLISDAVNAFTKNGISSLKFNYQRILDNLNNSLMLVTALAPKIGYIEASKIAKYAFENNISIKEAASKLADISDIDLLLDPENMI